MKNKKWLGLILVLVVALSAGLTGCKKDTPSANADAEQFLNTIMFEQRTLDISDAEDVDSAQVLTETMEGLTRVESNGTNDEIKPGIAKDWKVSDDGLVYTFNLRDAKWTDGKPVTAQQFVDSWLRLLDPEKGYGYSYFAYDVKGATKYNAGEGSKEDVGVKAVNDTTFEVTLERPTPYFIKKVGFKNLFPIRIEEVEAQGETYGTDFTKMSFNGPYVITEYISNNKIVLEKNATYWDAENVKLAKITMQEITETSTLMQMYESNQIDLVGASGDYLKSFREKAKAGEFVHYSGGAAGTYYFSVNVQGGPSGLMSNEKVRKAMAYALDREDIATNVYSRYLPAYGLVPPSLSIGDKEYRSEVAQQIEEDIKAYDTIDKVTALYKEGLTELGKDPNGTYEILYLASGTDALNKSRQEYYQNAFQKLPGLKVNIQVAADSNQFWDLFDALEYDFVLSGWIGDYDDPMTFMDLWVTGGGNNGIKYSSADYDKLMNDEIYKEVEDPKRMEVFAKAEKVLAKDMPIIPVFYTDKNLFVHNYVKGAQFPLFGATYELKYAYTEGRQ
ncbi:MAG: hypothetical protein K0R09_2545 [Clostridiales bacterium]|jgi:oligopeptide transport system substrate-binding protein|nr:hypothetical protein [Clostridiales bacterium]